jgi:hypothetical protein
MAMLCKLLLFEYFLYTNLTKYIYRKENVKKAADGQEFGNETFASQDFTVLFRKQQKGFVPNIWIISLTSDQYAGAARFTRLVDYAKKFKSAVRNAGYAVSYIGERHLSDDEYSSLYNQVVDQENLTTTHIDSIDDDVFDGTGL